MGACVVDEPVVGEGEDVAWSEAAPEEAVAEFGGRPPRSNCTANVQACLSSGLGSKPGGQPGHSRCSDCLDRCQGQGSWPDYTWDGKDCQWWNY